uniref:Histone acetyltransferase n=1 Tax=Steinernema glaseri TaxID=37863 RepID=A0A1I8ALF2_9BILA
MVRIGLQNLELDSTPKSGTSSPQPLPVGHCHTHTHTPSQSVPSCFYKFEEGDEGNKRRFYVSFECDEEEVDYNSDEELIWKLEVPPSYFGQKDLSFMRNTTCLDVLFG